MTATLHRFQIERIIRRYKSGAAEAVFRLGDWICCAAWIRGGVPGIEGPTHNKSRMSMHQAAALQSALQMALTWIEEEQGRNARTASTLVPSKSPDPAEVLQVKPEKGVE